MTNHPRKYFCMADALRLLLAILLYLGFGAQAWADEKLWQALRSGAVVGLLRHAMAPGGGDPEHFNIEDCATQRNLSEAGRQQARAIGAAFRHNGVISARVLSGRWCRCLDTARLLDLGPVEPFPHWMPFSPTQSAPAPKRRHSGNFSFPPPPGRLECWSPIRSTLLH